MKGRKSKGRHQGRPVLAPPETIDKLLLSFRVPRERRSLGPADLQALRQLLTLVAESSARIREEPDIRRFGDVHALVERMLPLTQRLGFANPPLQAIHYQRGASNPPNMPEAKVDGFQFSSVPYTWPNLEYCKSPKFLEAWGYRLHDPDGESFPKEFLLAACAELDDPSRPLEGDPWEHQSKGHARAAAIEILLRWKRHLSRVIRSIAPRDTPSHRAINQLSAEPIAVGRRKMGRPAGPVRDPLSDQRIFEDWKVAKGFNTPSIAAFARARGMDEDDVRTAIDRHRKRTPGGKK